MSDTSSWCRRRKGSLAAGVGAMALVAVLAQAAGACSQAGYTRGVNLNAGVTRVTLASTLVDRFRHEGLAVTSSGAPGTTADGLNLPVTGGLVWSETGWGSVNHGGQLVFADHKDGRRARFTDVHLVFLPTPELTAKTSSGSEIELFNVHLREQPATGITFGVGSGSHRHITYRDIGLDVSTSGAASINSALHTAVVKSGEWIGRASVVGRGQAVN